MTAIICKQERRREKVRQQKTLNGLDYLEVEADQKTLTVHFLGKAPVQLDVLNIRIEGGRRIRDIKVLSFSVTTQEQVEFDDILQVVVDKAGDFSNYTLRVVEKNEQGDWQTHAQFDPRYDRIEFNFKVDCPNELDCKQDVVCQPETREEPEINYLARDYASFHQLIFDRLALLMPEWQERHTPDVGVALVEILAYVGDHLSYYQDAVATEAYLDTARQRISIRRHARLVDYTMHEGCNARAWICLQVAFDIPAFAAHSLYFVAGLDETLQSGSSTIVTQEQLLKIPNAHYQVFEPISDTPLQFYADHNSIKFYTWGDQQCCLPRGATSATLLGEWITTKEPDSLLDSKVDTSSTAKQKSTTSTANEQPLAPKLHLTPDDVIIIEEVIGPTTGHPQDANPEHRQAVRLTTISPDRDPLTGQHVVNITWCAEDALTFPLCLSALGPAPDCLYLKDISIACANVVLVDHGRSVTEDLPPVPEGEALTCCKDTGVASETTHTAGRFNPVLQFTPLTYCQPNIDSCPASRSLEQDSRLCQSKIKLQDNQAEDNQSYWHSRLDLLSSLSEEQHFVVELDDAGNAQLRFGDGEMGRRPAAGQTFRANYRIGNGLLGNVGAEAIKHLVFTNEKFSGINSVRNPMSAQGGHAQEPLADVKLYAPHAFRKELQRAIIADDYAAIVKREFSDKVQSAIARLRWHGSGYQVLVAVDAFGQEQADQVLLTAISSRLHRYRRIGHDLLVKSAQRVALDIELRICVLPSFLRAHVKAELLQLLSNKKLANNKLGFFHADNLTFGDDIYLSKLVAVSQSVTGVESVTVIRMQRWCEPANNEIEMGVLALANFEIARLDNDPSLPENGKLNLDMRGGR